MSTRTFPIDAGGEVEILVTASNVRLRAVDGDTVTIGTRDGEPIDDEVQIEATPGKVRIRDNERGLKLGPIRVSTRAPRTSTSTSRGRLASSCAP